MSQIILLSHPTFGVLAVLAAIWVFVDTLNANLGNRQRIRSAAWLVAIFLWLSYLAGGYWYVNFYGPERDIIKAGPWPFAHSFFMEMKEHLFFVLLLLGTYLPMTASHPALATDRRAQRLVLTVAALIVLLGLAMEGAGAVISLGVKEGLLAR